MVGCDALDFKEAYVMNRRFKMMLAACTIALVMAVTAIGALACTSIALPPGSTADGSSYATHTADSGSTPWEFYKVPAAKYAPGTMMEILDIPQASGGYQLHEVAMKPTGNQVPQATETYGYIKSGIFGYLNEQVVGIGETTIGGRRELANQNGYFDITHLSMLAMERGKTAREAIKVMGSMAEKYGYSDGGEELSVIDGKEAWVFEIIGPGPLWQVGDKEPGAFWVAQRVKDGNVAISANHPVIDVIDFNNPDEFMFAPGIKEYAIAQGWYKPESGELFSWRKHFMNNPRIDYSARRIWRIMTLLNPDLLPTLDVTNLPFQAPVKDKVTLAKLISIQRDHYEGTEFDMTQGLGAGPWNNPRRFLGAYKADGITYTPQRTINVQRCEYVTVVQCRAGLPNEIAGVLWMTPVCGDAGWFLPLYAGITELNPSLTIEKCGDRFEFRRDSYRWAISSLSTYMNLKWSFMYPDVCAIRDKYEGELVRNQAAFDKSVLELYNKDKAAAIKYLTDFCSKNVDTFREAVWQTLDYLVWKYDMGFVTENGKVNGKGYPAEWIDKLFKYNFGTSDIRGWSNYVAPTK